MRNASRTSSLETSRGQLSWAARGLDQPVERSGGSSRAKFAPRVVAVVCLQNGRGAATQSLLATNFQPVMASASSRLRMPQRKVKSSLERRSHLVEGVIFKLINAKSDLIFGKDGLPSQLACETGSSNGGRADGPHNGPGWHDD
jgi:hypothetical protein